MNTNTIYFQFKDILSTAITGSAVTLTPLIWPLASGSKTVLNNAVPKVTDITGSVYYNTVLPNLFEIQIAGGRNKKNVVYYALVPTSSNNSLPFNASTYIISASIDNGNPTSVYFDLSDTVINSYQNTKVRLSPATPYIPNVNSGSVVPGDFKDFITTAAGTFTASNVVPGLYNVQCYSNKNIPEFTIYVPANSGSLNVNTLIRPSSDNQINISFPFVNGPGQSMTIQQLFATFQTKIISGSYLSILVDNALEADFSILSFNSISSSFATFATNAYSSVSASWSNTAVSSVTSISSSWSPNQGATTLNTGSTYPITASFAITTLNVINSVNASSSISSSYAVFATNSATASYALNASNGSTIITGSLIPITSSQAISASWAIERATFLNTGSTYFVTSSWATNAINANSASVSTTSSYSNVAALALTSNTANNVTNSNAVNTFFPTWNNGVLTNTSSLKNVGNNISSSGIFAPIEIDILSTGSFPFNIKNNPPWINTVASINLPDGVNPELLLVSNDTSSVIRLVPTGSVTFNNAGNVIVKNTLTASVVQASLLTGSLTGSSFGTASWAKNSTTASVSINSFTSSFSPSYVLKIGDNLSGPLVLQTAASIDCGNSSNGIRWLGTSTAAKATVTLPNDTSLAITLTTGSTFTFSGSQMLGTSSWANNCNNQTSSTFNNSITITTGSIQGAFLNFIASGIGGGVSSLSVNPAGLVCSTNFYGQNFFGTTFIGAFSGDGSALTNVSASTSGNSVTSSFALSSRATTLFTGSVYQITASQAVSASWCPPFSTLVTGSLVPITASWAQSASKAITASYSLTTIATASFVSPGTYLITSSWANNSTSASLALNSSTSSYSPNYVLKAGDSVTGPIILQTAASVDCGNSSNGIRWLGTGTTAKATITLPTDTSLSVTLTTGSTFTFTGSLLLATASWARTVVSASIASLALTASSISFVPLTSSFAPTAKTASLSVTALTASSLNFTPATSSYAVSASHAFDSNQISYASSSVFVDNFGSIHLRNVHFGQDYAYTDQAGSSNVGFNVQHLAISSLAPPVNNTIVVTDVVGNLSAGPVSTDQLPTPTTAATLGSSTAIVNKATGSYMGIFNDYIITSGSALRCGSIFAGFLGSNITYTEYTTNTIGTVNVTCSIALSGPNVQFVVSTTQPSNVYNCKVITRFV